MKGNPDKFRNIKLHKKIEGEHFISFRQYLILDKAGNYHHVHYRNKFIINHSLLEIEWHEIDFIGVLP